MAESLLTPKKAAQLLAVRPKTIRDWLKRGRETQSWLDADASSPLPPYDWGPSGPPKGHPVRYVSGVGLTIEKEPRG